MKKAASLVVLALAFSVQAHAAKFTVDKTEDVRALSLASACGAAADDCSLRDAVRKANLDATADTIVLPAGTYRLTLGGSDDTAFGGDLDITTDMTIQGAGAATVCGASGTCVASQVGQAVFHFLNNVDATVRGMTLEADSDRVSVYYPLATDGSATIDSCVIGGSGFVGVYAEGDGGEVVIRNSKITDGGISNLNMDMTVENSTITGNFDAIGGIRTAGASANLKVFNTTISGNHTFGDGGGIDHRDGILELNGVTIANNHADGDGGGLFSDGGGLFMSNTLIAGNTTDGAGKDCAGTMSSKKFNLIGTTTGCGIAANEGDLFGTDAAPVDPLLGPLALNGGPWETHLLLAGSPAIDAGTPVSSRTGDQRGATSPFDGNADGTARVDIGAVEVGCGNAFLESGEACDDGNTAAGDGCSAACANEGTPACGDGILQAGEGCDDGNSVDDDACKNDCTTPAVGGTTGGDTGGDTSGDTSGGGSGGTSGDSGGGCSLVR